MLRRLFLIAACAILYSLVLVLSLSYFEKGFRNYPRVYATARLTDASDSPEYFGATDSRETLVAIYISGYLYHQEHDHGINKEFIEELGRRLNMDLRIEVIPRARIDWMLAEGTLPMSVSAVETPERAEHAWYVPYFVQKNDVLISSELGITKEEELLERTEVKVGIIRGYYYGEHYSELIEKLKAKKMVVEAKDTETLFQMLKDGWIQVTFNIPASYLYYFDTLGIENIIAMDWAPWEEPLKRCLSLSKRYYNQEDVRVFERVINEMRGDSTLCDIFSRHLPNDVARRMCMF